MKPHGNSSQSVTNELGEDYKHIDNGTSDAMLLAAILINTTYPRLQKYKYLWKTQLTTNPMFLRSQVCLDTVGG